MREHTGEAGHDRARWGSDAETQQDPLRSLAVLVVNYASHDLVEQNLKRSLGDGFPGQVIIADNYSGEAERAAIAAVASRGGWTLLPLEDNEDSAGRTISLRSTPSGMGRRSCFC